MTNVFKEVEDLPFENGIYQQHKDLEEVSSLEGYDMAQRILSFQNLSNFVHLFRNWIGYNFIKKNCKNDESVVELGSGYSEIPHLLASNFGKYNYYCMEFEQKKLNTASKRKIGTFNRVLIKSDLSRAELPFPDNSIDAVLSIEFLEHVPKESGVKLIQEINRVLKIGKLGMITTPNANNSETVEAYHIYEYALEDLRKLIQLSGFEIVDTFGLNIAKQIKNLDKEYEESSSYKYVRKYLPTPIVKPFFSLDKPEESRAVGFVFKKIGSPDIEKISQIDFSLSDSKNNKQQERNEDWKTLSNKQIKNDEKSR